MEIYSREDLVRRQLGAATHLFIADLDPISVHCLVSSAAEHASFLARDSGTPTFNDHILATFPERKLKDIQKLRNQFWTPIKHSCDNSRRPFDLPDALEAFSDQANDHALFIVWHDYLAAGFPLPLEAQIFQVWYYGIYPEKLYDNEGSIASHNLFGPMKGLSRTEQKVRLKSVVDEYRGNPDFSDDPKTDPRSLVLP